MAIAFGTVTDAEEQYSPIDDGKYMFQVADLQQLEPNEWGNPRIQWFLPVAEQGANGKWVPVLDSEGQQYVKYAYTNLPKEGKPMGPNNQTRIMVEKILGRKLEDGETASDEMVRGKVFVGMLGPYRSKTGKVSQILMPESIKPMASSPKGKAAPPPPPPVAEDTDDDDDDELPFG
jgi:hypothetical protein